LPNSRHLINQYPVDLGNYEIEITLPLTTSIKYGFLDKYWHYIANVVVVCHLYKMALRCCDVDTGENQYWWLLLKQQCIKADIKRNGM
jgi:hypothetical protein